MHKRHIQTVRPPLSQLVRLAVMATIALVAVAACTSDGPLISINRNTTSSAPSTPTSTSTPTPVLSPTAVPPTPRPVTATAVPTTPPTSTPIVALPDPAADGFPGWLRVNGFGPVDFGTSQAQALTWIAPRLGGPVTVSGNAECGLVVASWDSFSLAFESDRLVGWFYTSSNPALQSPSGVAPGIPINELRRVYQGVDIAESTLGLEFFFEVPAGFMGGLFTDDEQQVSQMFAGQNCFFR